MSTDVVPAGTYDTGLDDLGDAIQVPRLRIGHKTGTIIDPNTGQEFPKINAFILGLVRQRVLFHVKVDEKDKPMCKSPDAKMGFPNLEPADPKKAFPWDKAELEPSQAQRDEQGRLYIACGSCKLKEWGSHPLGDKPYCSEQYTLAIIFAETKEELLSENGGMPALLTVQKTGIKPARTYLQTFKLKGVGAYTVVTEIGLDMKKQGDTVYSTPTFRHNGDSPQERWLDFSQDFLGIQDFLLKARPPAPDVQDGNGVKANEVLNGTATANTAPSVARPTVSTPATVAPPATAPVDSDDDLPF